MKNYLVIIFSCFCLASFAQSEDASRRRNFNLDHDIAIKGFDPVSYFNGKPAKGDTKFSWDYKGVTYYFVNEANLEAFKKSPAKFEPAYGGWCAYTVALNGERVKVDPTVYKITDGKLYLFYNFNGENRLLKWNKEEQKLKPLADRHWREKMH
jgi:YHS domain-containing protein